LLVPVLSLFLVVMTGNGHPASRKPSKGGIFAVLMNPLGFFAERSPGRRGSGALLSTKPERKSALADAPHERVLSTVRQREPASGVPPVADNSAPGNPIFDTAPDMPAEGGILPGDTGGVVPGDSGPPSDQMIGASAFPPPYDFFGVPGAGSVSAVPEPGTWAMMILGFAAVGMALRRRGRKQACLTCVAPDPM
jgi:hypothetical protein